MLLVAVIVGYILGILPFILPKIADRLEQRKQVEVEVKENKSQEEILDEWLNGPRKINQEDIYKEYVTGKESTKGD